MRRMIFIALLIVSGLSAPYEAHSAEEAIPPEENAATYYRKAFELMEPWPNEEARMRAFDIIGEGWKEEDEELEQLLKANQPAFEEFRKGVLKERCRFVFGEITYEMDLPHLGKARGMAQLLMLEARLHQRNGNLAKALKNSLDVIKLGHDCGTNRIILSKLVDNSLCGISGVVLKDLVRSEDLRPAVAKKTLEDLLKLEKKAVSAREVLEGEIVLSKSALRWMLKEMEKEADKEGNRDLWNQMQQEEHWINLLRKEFDLLIEEYFATIIIFVEKGDYQAVSTFVDICSERMEADELSIFDIPRANERVAQKMAEIFANMLLPAVRHSLFHFGRYQAKERLTIGTLAIRLFQMEKGRWPQNLDELVPEYLDEVPLDPFGLKPLNYKKREGKWIIYSIGPDGKDDGGIKEYVYGEAEEGTDLIYMVE